MAKKTLTEAAVRRFQTLANVAPINEMYHANRDEDKKHEGAHEDEEGKLMKEEDDAPMGDDPMGDAPMGDAPMGDDPMAADEDPMDAGGEETLEITDEKLQSFVDAVDSIADFAEMFKAQAGDMDPEGGDLDAPMDLGPEDEVDPDGDDDMESVMEGLRGINYIPSKKEIVNEVAQRVARRLKAAKLHEAKLNKALGKKR